MKGLVLAALMMAAMWGCEKDSDEEIEIIEEPVVNYLENTEWQQYTPIGDTDFMIRRYLIFKEDGICEYVDSIRTTVSIESYYYDPIYGEAYQGLYFTKLYEDAAKTEIYEEIYVEESLDRLYYFLSWGNTTTKMKYKRIN
jgi:hypothetical protein